eukprot:g8748.t1
MRCKEYSKIYVVNFAVLFVTFFGCLLSLIGMLVGCFRPLRRAGGITYGLLLFCGFAMLVLNVTWALVTWNAFTNLGESAWYPYPDLAIGWFLHLYGSLTMLISARVFGWLVMPLVRAFDPEEEDLQQRKDKLRMMNFWNRDREQQQCMMQQQQLPVQVQGMHPGQYGAYGNNAYEPLGGCEQMSGLRGTVPYDESLVPLFLFVNPNSGGGIGEAFLKVPRPFDAQLRNSHSRARLWVFSLYEGRPGDKPGFHFLREVVKSYHSVRVFIGGGDGTVMWVVGEAQLHGIQTETSLKIGMVPLGTGNDFAQALGWGGRTGWIVSLFRIWPWFVLLVCGRNPDADALLRNNCEMLDEMVQEWVRAEPEIQDVWKVRLKVHEEDGFIYNKDAVMMNDDGSERTSLETHMLLYCGIAKDAELAYQVPGMCLPPS